MQGGGWPGATVGRRRRLLLRNAQAKALALVWPVVAAGVARWPGGVGFIFAVPAQGLAMKKGLQINRLAHRHGPNLNAKK